MQNAKFQRNTHVGLAAWRKCEKPCPICPFTAAPQKYVQSPISEYEHSVNIIEHY
jgi:hypothetical protein